MSLKDCFLIVNPTSGGFSEQKISWVTTTLRQQGWSPNLLLTGNADDASLFARRICTEVKTPFIIAGGGDGTVNGVINGLVSGQATMGILPLGTANVLAKELRITSLEDGIAKIARGATRPLSVGLIEARGTRKYFSLMAGIGVDGAVVKAVRLSEKKLIGKGAYVLAALRQLTTWDVSRLQIAFDSRIMDCHSAIVCNAKKYGGEFVLAPTADVFAPGFQVLCIRDSRRSTYLNLALAMLRGKPPRGDAVELVHAREIEVCGSKAAQVDGDYYGESPFRIVAVDNFVRIVV